MGLTLTQNAHRMLEVRRYVSTGVVCCKDSTISEESVSVPTPTGVINQSAVLLYMRLDADVSVFCSQFQKLPFYN